MTGLGIGSGRGGGAGGRSSLTNHNSAWQSGARRHSQNYRRLGTTTQTLSDEQPAVTSRLEHKDAASHNSQKFLKAALDIPSSWRSCEIVLWNTVDVCTYCMFLWLGELRDWLVVYPLLEWSAETAPLFRVTCQVQDAQSMATVCGDSLHPTCTHFVQFSLS